MNVRIRQIGPASQTILLPLLGSSARAGKTLEVHRAAICPEKTAVAAERTAMMKDGYGRDPGEVRVVYWIVPPVAELRHAITDKPGAWPAFSKVEALCGRWVKIPCATPFGTVPRSKSIAERCPECVTVYEGLGCRSTVWDF